MSARGCEAGLRGVSARCQRGRVAVIVRLLLRRRKAMGRSVFYGIVTTLNYNDHAPPHFHARYGGDQPTISVEGIVLAGSLPARALARQLVGR
jgi:hypothetical protein